ncbi:hypothetical protein BGZ65_002583 [Modicella reniformis]|uniref:Uncharacterized protein n=1 Tax=Modicella reniformis TaxID=1440133 RepID=A0A9P6MIG9_9FUNG|nr:hypothetical protein BGZ65_002583 [Modicella reniformis]
MVEENYPARSIGEKEAKAQRCTRVFRSGQQSDDDGGAGADADTGASDLPATTPAAQVYFDPDKAISITLILAGCDIGPSFKVLQREAASFVNDKMQKVSISKLHFLTSV